MPDTYDGAGYENQDKEAVAMVEELPSSVGMNSSTLYSFAKMW